MKIVKVHLTYRTCLKNQPSNFWFLILLPIITGKNNVACNGRKIKILLNLYQKSKIIENCNLSNCHNEERQKKLHFAESWMSKLTGKCSKWEQAITKKLFIS